MKLQIALVALALISSVAAVPAKNEVDEVVARKEALPMPQHLDWKRKEAQADLPMPQPLEHSNLKSEKREEEALPMPRSFQYKRSAKKLQQSGNVDVSTQTGTQMSQDWINGRTNLF